MVALRDVGDPFADLLDHPGAFMPEHGGERRPEWCRLIMDRSEWHTPVAAIRTSTSPVFGGARSTSTTE